MDIPFFLKVFAALFAIMSPIANLPVFLALTGDRDAAGKRTVALTAVVALCIGTVVVFVGGEAILTLFGISIDGFRLAGGLLILLIALSMLHGGESAAHAGSEAEREHHRTVDNPGIYPLAVPMLLGPGSISTIVIFREQAKAPGQEVALVAALAAIVILLGATFLAGPVLSRLLGRTAVSIMSRLMGMLLAAIAMEMMVTSLKVLLPGLA
ncbi:MarC family protein [Stappia sp.]|uniref:MarC family protein n=1 Tax=Stappia sp. TaxID=1870903 RepID=UPI003A9A1C5D